MATTPDELKGDRRRQAVASIRGSVYQAWCSIDAWLRLSNAEQVIYLEGAEDFDVVGGTGGDFAVQVKHNEGSISLGNAKAHEALENFWALAEREPSRVVSMHYLTTSAAVVERDTSFGGICGVDAWRAARTNLDLAKAVADYVASKLKSYSALSQFLTSASPGEIQEQVLNRFHWFTDQPDTDAVQRSVDDRISVLLAGQQQSTNLTPKVRVQLESRFWELITKEPSSLRCLTLGDLLRQVEQATTAYLPLPVDRLSDLLATVPPGLGLLKLLIQKAPRVPLLLIPRVALTQRVRTAVEERRAVLLTGTVYKGKTTLAQHVVQMHCPEAWWVNLTERRTDQVDNVLLALAGEIERGECPGLVVIDDLDISPQAYRAYRDSLSLVMHRARESGHGIILTARGSSSESAQLSAMGRLEVVEIPELSEDEVKNLCIQEGCSIEHSDFWSLAVLGLTRGHPKLVQVRLIELSERGWPIPSASDFVAPSPAAQSTKQLARQLLSQSVPPEVAEFVYCASESSVLLHRSVALALAELVGLPNGGDVLDSLAGKWIERIEDNWHRTTPLLQGAAADVWTVQRRQMAHIQLHDAIFRKRTLDPSEAAALLYHAFFGCDWARVAHDSLRLQMVDDDKSKREVERNLMWLPYVALDKGQFIAGSARAGAPLRSLQFRVAVTLDADTLPQICDRWAEELLEIEEPLLSQGMHSLMWNSVSISDTLKVPLRHRLAAIMGLTTLTGEMQQLSLDGTKRFFDSNSGYAGIPRDGTLTQLLLALSSRWVRDADALAELVRWLDTESTDEIRGEFDSVLEWSLVQTMGAFVQGAWSSNHETTTEWPNWIVLFSSIEDYAARRGSRRFGQEAAKAKAIILCEYMNDSVGALAALAHGEVAFGKSPILDEQRANVLFQGEDDEQVLSIWADLMGRSDAGAVTDPFAYRRAAISAWRLGRRLDASDTFRAGAKLVEPQGFALTRFGLLVDCALVELQDSRVRDAAHTLAEAVFELPAEASEDGGERWEPVQRAAVEVCRCIEKFHWNPQEAIAKFDPGFASSPARKLERTEPGQAGRHLLLRAQCARLAATHGLLLPKLETELDFLRGAPYRMVRWTAAEGKLAWSYGAGAHFMESLVSFDLATGGLASEGKTSSIVMPDEGVELAAVPRAERWFGFLIAGAWVSGPALEGNLRLWLDWLQTRPENIKVQQFVVQLMEGVGTTRADLEKTVRDMQRPPAVRCGAAMRQLLNPLSVVERINLLGFLTSAVVSDGSYTRQEVFNLHLARRVAEDWKGLCDSPFNFRSPNRVVPALLEAVRSVEIGRGTLRTIMSSIYENLGQKPPEFMNRVW